MSPLTTVEWFGTATFRVRDAGLDLFFDAYLDRLPGLEPVGLSTLEVRKAEFVFVSHAHFDHLYGAGAIATRTGATIVCSPESARCLRAAGVPEAQLLVVTGGETVRCGPTTTVRVLPSLHSCLFAHSEGSTRTVVVGPQRTVSPPVTTSNCASGTAAARRQRADSGEQTTVAPGRVAMDSAP